MFCDKSDESDEKDKSDERDEKMRPMARSFLAIGHNFMVALSIKH